MRLASLLLVSAVSLTVGCGENAGSDAGGGSPGPGSDEPVAYGDGEYAILLSGPEPRIYCWYIEETVNICDGSTQTDYLDICLQDEPNCLLHQPDDIPPNGTDTCYTRVDYSTVGGSFLYGDCEHHAAYWSADPDVECLFHGHCEEGERCVDYQCQ
jgi:hypothetical protein